jgi:hypothetical protein
MTSTSPLLRSAAQRRDICRRNSEWPEVRVAEIKHVAVSFYHVTLTCGHVTGRIIKPQHDATIVCEQCAEAPRR